MVAGHGGDCTRNHVERPGDDRNREKEGKRGKKDPTRRVGVPKTGCRFGRAWALEYRKGGAETRNNGRGTLWVGVWVAGLGLGRGCLGEETGGSSGNGGVRLA